MVLVEVPFAGRIWALPALTPSKVWSEGHGQRHRTVTEWARLMLLAIHRWLPGRLMVAVMDGEFAALDLLYGLSITVAFFASYGSVVRQLGAFFARATMQ